MATLADPAAEGSGKASDVPAALPHSVVTKSAMTAKGKPLTTATAVFAGGCFWCTEAAFEQLKGVVDVQSGYAGGTKETANYERVSTGSTGHAEAIRITYDPTQISYDRLLDVFFDAHDPTQLNRQDNDAGTQYRSTIFYVNEIEERAATAKIKQLTAAKVFTAPIVTTLEPLKEFYPAEEYHQDYAAASESALHPVPCSPEGLHRPRQAPLPNQACRRVKVSVRLRAELTTDFPAG